MNPKQKAAHLVITYMAVIPTLDIAKECAMVAVNEILNLEPPELSYMEPFSKSWWQEVQLELTELMKKP